MRFKGFGVQCLETLCLSADLVFNVSKRCACQRIWCSVSRNAVPVSSSMSRNLCLSATESGNVAPVSGFGIQILGTLQNLLTSRISQALNTQSVDKRSVSSP